MARVIILEGPDGSGKSTLAHYLEEEYGFKYEHTGVPATDNLLVEYATRLHDAVKSGQRVVFDRLYLGESIYGPLLRNHDRLNGEEGRTILQRIVRAGDVLEVFCEPPYQQCYRNWFSRRSDGKELVESSNTFLNIYNAYEKFRKSREFARSVTYDYTKIDFETAYKLIVRSERTPRLLPPDVIGSPTAKFLFVGEIANQESLDLPWVSLDNSSSWLFHVLKGAGFVEDEMAFTNALTLDKKRRNLHEVFTYMPDSNKLNFIALGKVAENTLHYFGYGSRTKALPHPAFWKRF